MNPACPSRAPAGPRRPSGRRGRDRARSACLAVAAAAAWSNVAIAADAGPGDAPAPTARTPTAPAHAPPPLPAQPNDRPPPLPAAAAVRYFYARDDREVGPVGLEQMKALIRDRQIQRHTLVWTAGMAQWERAELRPDLAEVFRDVPVARPRDWTGFMLGPWTYEMNRSGLPLKYVVNYSADGRYRGSVGAQMRDAFGQTMAVPAVPVSGTWKVTPMDDDRFQLEWTEDNVPQSTTLRRIDRNTLYDELQGHRMTRF